jgi:hypothetical protein
MHVIGLGVGRTGTYSLKLAINRLGFGPCHHMERVMQNLPTQVPLWTAALDGNADWPAIYAGCGSAVDWPTAGFFRELCAAYPDARFILTERSPQTWAASFSETIQKILADQAAAPPHLHAWLAMADRVITRTGFASDMDIAGLQRAFIAHNEAVKALIPPERLLVYEVRQGWEPLCVFLGVPVPDEAFPRTNNREEFWDLVRGNT